MADAETKIAPLSARIEVQVQNHVQRVEVGNRRPRIVLIGYIPLQREARRPGYRGAPDQPDAIHDPVTRVKVRLDIHVGDERGTSYLELLLHHQTVTQPGRELIAIAQPAKIGAQAVRHEYAAHERESPVQFEKRRVFPVRLALVIKAPPAEIPSADHPVVHLPRLVFIH